MSTQSESELEYDLIGQLKALHYAEVSIKDETDLLQNLKNQLEKHNEVSLSERDFQQVLHWLNKGTIFERAKTLRDKMPLEQENGDTVYIEFLNMDKWCQNEYQVASQITMEDKYINRYDVTLLVNGLPLVQIELKRRGLELKEAFNQINRYQRHSFGASVGLFRYVQLFVISNGVNTKYFANNSKISDFKQTFFWATEDNTKITDLSDFTAVFLDRCHVSKMICRYTVLHETDKILMVLRPYQYYATEAIIERVKKSDKNGYIWHTTGSGKTLTSFKASQILTQMPKVDKVVFVVDRRDLDDQTVREFNNFSEGSVDSTTSTKNLVKHFKNPNNKLIVTTLQKLNTAILNKRYWSELSDLKDKKIVFIFDECHRSQFGETHKNIKEFFRNHQMFGFTGTPIFGKNAVQNEKGKRTTVQLFDECLHEYVITDAIRDENVLKFSIEYIGKYEYKNGSKANLDIEVEDINTKELLESPERLEKITDYILAHHDRKTHSREFTAMFCVSSTDVAVKYYELFKSKKHNLKIATIFSYQANEEVKDDLGTIPDVNDDAPVNVHKREKLDEFIQDYNQQFSTNYSTKDSKLFQSYYKDVSKRVKHREIDILLVVNMFLTGFDSKALNTLYVDKNLKYHGLIQAFSRTNRIKGSLKSQGNIVAFRNLNSATDEAIRLFSDKNAEDVILLKPYEDYVENFKEALAKMKALTPNFQSVDELETEEQEAEFIKNFRDLIRLKNTLSGFVEFEFEDLDIEEQEFEDYKSKYLDLYQKVRNNRQKEKVSILNDVDFELELIQRDEINVAYIMRLLQEMKGTSKDEQERKKQAIQNILSSEVTLRSKRDLINEFIEENLPNVANTDEVEHAFHEFWHSEKVKAFETICQDEKLVPEKTEKVVSDYLYNGRKPLKDTIIGLLLEKPKLLQRKKVTKRVTDKIMDFIDTFIEGV